MNKHTLIPAHPENPGYLLKCTHPSHGICLIHVGCGDIESIDRAMARCGTVPLEVGDPGVQEIRVRCASLQAA